MGQIRVVLIFNEDNERQKEIGEYLKSQKRCKTALITELVYGIFLCGQSADRNVSWICADDPEFRNFNEESGIGSRCAKRTGYFWIRERP